MTMQPTVDRLEALTALKAALGDLITLDEDVRSQFETDYGRVVFQTPGAVARCKNAEEVAQVVRYCREHGVPIVGRGPGHTQTGQSTTDGGVLFDTSAMQQIHEIDEDALLATCDAGVIWRDLTAATVEQGLVPRVLTNNLGVSLGGTLSVAGLGVASFRYGCQTDNVAELEVVTGTGEIVVCSREENTDLFDVVRSGLSQFGIITKAKIMLRRCKPMVRKYYLMYDDLGALMRDTEKAMSKEDRTIHSVESWCSPCLGGVKKIGAGMDIGVGAQTFAYWLYPLHVTVEYDEGDEPNDEEILSRFEPYKELGQSDFTQHEFCERLVPIFQLWDRSGYSDMAHPWMETVLPWDKAQEYIELALSQLPPQALGPGGHILLWPSRGDTSDTPLFKHPGGKHEGGEFVMGWGILPGVPKQFLDQALATLDMASELSIGYGGKRYLSGYITFDSAERWEQHFGAETFAKMKEAKAKYDPEGILNPGFIQYE